MSGNPSLMGLKPKLLIMVKKIRDDKTSWTKYTNNMTKKLLRVTSGDGHKLTM
jgi:hypothetical protein